MENITAALKGYGLAPKEIIVYLALLELGSTKASEIAKRSKIPRETAYGLLESLQKKEIISTASRGGIKYYSAASPVKLIQDLKEKAENISKVLPELKLLEEAQIRRPKVEIFEGKEGVRNVFDEAVSMPNSKIYGIYNGKFGFKILPFQIYRAIEQKIQNKVHSDLIMDDSEHARDYQKLDKKQNRRTRILDFMKDVKAGMFIYGDKIAYMTYDQKEPVGIIIDDKHINNFNKEMFEFMWKLAKK
tara:strand:+ start:1302 stop:2039 length:738 start_codon:yes stop_codon:yes gene_type:complete